MLNQMVNTLDYLCTITSFEGRAKRCVENLCVKAAEDCIATLSQPVSSVLFICVYK